MITFNFAIKVSTKQKTIYRTIFADSSCEAFKKCIENISETEVNITEIKLISRDDRNNI